MEHLLRGLDVVLVQTRFPENIGMAARACVNMGCGHISLVEPERWLRDKASPLATPKGQALLDGITVHPSLADAVADSALVIGTTARRGGWRQSLLSPERCAEEVAGCLRQGGRVSLVFGPEDRGLDNAAITHCHRLVCIPTDPAASSLNLAQAVLIVLYACAAAVREGDRRAATGPTGTSSPSPATASIPAFGPQTETVATGQSAQDSPAVAAGPTAPTAPTGPTGPRAETVASSAGNGEKGEDSSGPLASAADQERLMAALREMLLRIDYLHGDNPDYFLMPWRRLFGRARLRRHEYDALMGMCRQVRRALDRAEKR